VVDEGPLGSVVVPGSVVDDAAGPSVLEAGGVAVVDCIAGSVVVEGMTVVELSAAVLVSGAPVVDAGAGVVGMTKHSGQPGQPLACTVALVMPESQTCRAQAGTGHSATQAMRVRTRIASGTW
jgi:hypothetical protein